jgi:hypothetical protein
MNSIFKQEKAVSSCLETAFSPARLNHFEE